ncbi:hypothetical protein E6W36_08655 [Hankyongella ginsenosidimutans]|uniref:Peptidase S8/S53 domain-containing protein n=1 Tax=Hankyongella ginsenosidimutans TaxID=1763828 RepID=A0A4D7C6W6_9SPHN|nr:hypothetical protein E6W36_08655 [Hankyongella ginsenosidimutans]
MRATGIGAQQFIVSGTSFAAPHVAGALALLADAFPTLTSRQLVDLLLSSATDLGSPGQDPVFGRGGLNIARAFQPQGSTRLAGTDTLVSLSQADIALGGALGNGAQLGSALRDVVVLDRFNRAFSVNLGPNVRAVTSKLDLARQLQRRAHIEEQWLSSRTALRLTFSTGARRQPGARSAWLRHPASARRWVGRRPFVSGSAPRLRPDSASRRRACSQGSRRRRRSSTMSPTSSTIPSRRMANGTLSFAATGKIGRRAEGLRIGLTASTGQNRNLQRDSQWALRQAPPRPGA